MQHQEVVELINTLSPQLNEGTPEDVLIKEARDRGLSPAILEKMGQVYNMAATLDKMTKAAGDDRGQTIYQVDNEAMVRRYITEFPEHDKEATVAPVQLTHTDPAQLNLLTLCRAQAAPEEEEVVKAAAAPQEIPVTVQMVADIHQEIFVKEAEIEQAAADLLKHASAQTSGSTLDFSEAHKDAASIGNIPVANAAMDYLQKFAASRWTVKREVIRAAESEMFKRASDEMTDPFSPEFCSIAILVQQRDNLIQDLQDKSAAAVIGSERDTERLSEMLGDFGIEQAPENPGSSINFEVVDDDNSPVVEEGNNYSESLLSAPDAKSEKSDKDGDSSDKAEKGKGLKVPSPSATGGDVRQKMLKALGASDGDTHNSAQMVADNGVRDIRRLVSLRRLMGTDEVLRHMPEADVMSAYNTIAASNPDVADDPKLLALTLRDAVEHGGVPLETHNNLLKSKEQRISSDRAEAEENKKKYAVPGLQLPIPTKK